jgi:hypothetical protein
MSLIHELSPIDDILVLKFNANVISVIRISDQEKDSVRAGRLELHLDDELVLEVGEVGTVHGHEPLTVESNSAFWPFFQFVPEISCIKINLLMRNITQLEFLIYFLNQPHKSP